jgi:hypothetical protein
MPTVDVSARPALLRRPWVAESLVFFAVLWQESLRLEWRTAHRTLPIPARLTALYYYQCGDFANGYVNAFLIDGLTHLVRQWHARRTASPVGALEWYAVGAAVLSMLIIVGIELAPTALNNPDLADIPAGIVGALLYLGVRVVALRGARRATVSDR